LSPFDFNKASEDALSDELDELADDLYNDLNILTAKMIDSSTNDQWLRLKEAGDSEA
jgi:hypothetical protein